MDSITQFVLGASVGVLVMGRSQPVLKSALIGGACGTLPDLDALIEFGDPILNMVRHRGETHSLIWQSVAAPLIAAIVAFADRSVEQFFRWWLMVLLAFVTHAGLDVMTVYGTHIFLPQVDQPYGLGSIFVIDPLYTLPLLIGLLLTIMGRYRRRLYNVLGIIISCAYLVWSVYAQAQVTALVHDTPTGQAANPEKILVTPTALNTLVWRVVVMHDEHYDEGFYSILDYWRAPGKKIDFSSFKRDAQLDRATTGIESADRIRKFSRGFYTVSAHDQKIRITDLRMGQHPYFAFSFEFAQRNNRKIELTPVTAIQLRADAPIAAYFEWIWARVKVKMRCLHGAVNNEPAYRQLRTTNATHHY